MSPRKQVVEKYIDGFRRSDHAEILSCLSDNVVWALHGYKTLRGKQAFDAEIETEGFEGSPDDHARAADRGGRHGCRDRHRQRRAEGRRPPRIRLCGGVHLRGETVSRLDTYHVWLSQPVNEDIP
jgi:hypothetical protein